MDPVRDKIFGLKKNVFWLGLVSFFNDFSAEMVQSVMPVFLTTVLGAPIFVVGLIEGFADALASFLKIASGWVSDKIKRRKLPAVLGYVLSVAARPILALVTNYWQVFGLRVVDRVGKGVRDGPRDALISESVEREELGKSFGYHRMMDTFGSTLGPLVAFLILPLIFFEYRFLFLLAFVIGIFSILSFVFVRDITLDDKRQMTEDGKEKARPRLPLDPLKQNRNFTLFLLAIFIFGLGALPIPLLLLRSPEIGLGVGTVPLFYFIYSLAFVLTSIPFGRLSDKIGQRQVIIFGFLLAIAAYVGLALVQSFILLVLTFLIFGFYEAATDGIERALAAKLLEPPLLATGQGLLQASLGVSALLAGVLGGGLWNLVSSQAAFIYAASMSFIGLVMFIILTRPRVSPTRML